MRFVLGVDEAGRGPLAGPVAVGAVIAAKGFDVAKEFPGVGDSKTLSEGKREALYELLEQRASQGDARFCVTFADNVEIDRRGIVHAVRGAVFEAIHVLAPKKVGVHVYLDGLLKAPRGYSQETIIKGDALIPIISLASIAAKVCRDRFMREIALEYPHYGFERHKGYGTDLHYKKILELGPSPIHRTTFLHLDFMQVNS